MSGLTQNPKAYTLNPWSCGPLISEAQNPEPQEAEAKKSYTRIAKKTLNFTVALDLQ